MVVDGDHAISVIPCMASLPSHCADRLVEPCHIATGILVKQKGNSNASFYPDLKRAAALSAAVSAKPITWTLILSDENTLKGQKETLLPDGDSYKEGSVTVTWTRLN